MIQPKHNFKRSSICLAVMAVTSMGAYAQGKDASDDDLEIIEITGMKGSLKKSLNDKRFSRNIADTINAEDIGKSTDQNIADALGRVTGVTVVSADGEGTQITVRGADANQNSITLNGQTLTSTDFSQAVDLSSFSADVLSKLEVVKTSSANHDEGSLGASVNLITVRPLDLNKNIRSATVQGRYSDFSEKTNHRIQFSASEKFLDETLGVAINVSDETNAYRRDQYSAIDFIESAELDQVVDQDGNVISGVRTIMPEVAGYELHQNESNRRGVTLGVQYLPNDVSELMFDMSYSQQDLVRTFDAIRVRSNATLPNWEEGSVSTDLRPLDPATDPIDWIQVNTDSYDLTRRVNRYGAGRMARTEGGTDNDNFSSSLNFKTELTDTFRFEAQVGHSFSKSNSKPNASTDMQNWYQVPATALYDAGADIQPVGVDCSAGGDTCNIVHGSGLVDLGENIVRFEDETGALQQANADNIAITGFNPHDITSFHLGFINERDLEIEDTITNAQLDFEYDLDEFGITTIEFGAKTTKRNKSVDNQTYSFTTLAQTEVIQDELGNFLVEPGGSLVGLSGDKIQGETIPYDDFMASLGYARGPATQGWTPIDVFKAKDLILSDELTVRDPDFTETRDTDIDTQAAYLKFNFELLDGKLTGDIGVRYVKTDISATGYSGISFYEDVNGSDLERDIDRHTMAELIDTSLPECQAINMSEDGGQYNQKFQRVDGLGWDTSAGPDPATWVPIPDQGPCYDPLFVAYAQEVDDFRAGVTTTAPAFPAWQNMWRYADVSTSRFYGWDNLPTWNGDTSGQTTNYDRGPFTNKSLAAKEANNTHSYENVLPSLNLNYAFTDEFIGRFAASKTMTRPEIDLLRPGYRVNEGGYWGNGINNVGRVDGFNTKLEPLESNNLDLSLEWYFNETGLLSFAYFNKDMSNFTDRETSLAYITDVRESAPTSIDDLTLLAEEDGTGIEGCHPLRATTDFSYRPTDPTTFTDDLRDRCAEFTVTKTVNSKNATIQGIEIGYVQSYDFLPGWMGGLGVSANYTYQDSEYESEPSSINPNVLLPSYPVADTPKHSYNFTGFWEQKGHQIRLSFRGSSDSLVGRDFENNQYGRSWNQGSIWNEGRNTLDLSASYQVSPDISVTFQATNLTDEAYRTYFTSRTLEVVRVAADNAAGYDFVALEEGNPLEGDAPTHRTYTKYKVGSTYRLGVRVNF